MTDRQRKVVEELFRAYAAGVGRYVLSRVGDADVAEGIASRVFVKVVDAIGQCRGSAVGWMWAIVRSEVALYYRSRRTAEAIDEERRDPAAGPAQQAEARETMSRLHGAIGQLAPQQQELVEMKFFLAMPNVEIAAALGISAANVGVMAHRAIRRLRELMQGFVEETIDERKA